MVGKTDLHLSKANIPLIPFSSLSLTWPVYDILGKDIIKLCYLHFTLLFLLVRSRLVKMDALSTIASVYQYGAQIYGFVKTVKDAPKERQNFFVEIQTIPGSLDHLKKRIKDLQPGDAIPGYLKDIIELRPSTPGQLIANNIKPHGFRHRFAHPTKWLGHTKEQIAEQKFLDQSSAFLAKGLLKLLHDGLRELLTELQAETGIKENWNRVKWFWEREGTRQMVLDITRQRDNIDKWMQVDRDERTDIRDFNIIKIDSKVDSIVKTQKNEVWQRQRKGLTKWLSPLEPHSRQQEIVKDTFPSHCWLLKSSEYRTWVQGRPWYLWCYGESGSGKSVLAAQVTRYLKSADKNALVLDLFIDDQNNETKNLDNLIGSLVKQIIQDGNLEEIPSQKLKSISERGEHNTRPDLEDLIEVLEELFKRYTKVFLIIDAWEKIPNPTSIKLSRALKKLSSNGKLCTMVTATLAEEDSRERDIFCNRCKAPNLKGYYFCSICKEDFCDACNQKGYHCSDRKHLPMQPVDRVHIEVRPSEDELCQYVEWEISDATTSKFDRSINPREGSTSLTETELDRNLRSDPTLKQRIPQVVSAKSRNLYQWAKVYVDLIKLMPSVAQLNATLDDDMPLELNDFYDNMLKAINRIEPRASAKIVMDALYWITFAETPISFTALNHVLAINLGSWSHSDDAKVSEATLVRNSSGLINISFDKQSVRVHTTVSEWLRANKDKWFVGKERDAALKILTYLNYEDFNSPCPTNDDKEIATRLKDFPFLEYACQYWDEHVVRASSDQRVEEQVLKFLCNSGAVASYLQIIYHRGSQTFDLDIRDSANGLHLAAFFGLESMVAKLIANGTDVNSADATYGQTPLMYSCRRGHLQTVQTLLNHGASVDVWSKRGTNALFEAYLGKYDSEEARLQITNLLLDQDSVLVNARNEEKQRKTLLMLAACRDDSETIGVLLKRSRINVNCQDIDGNTALALAVYCKKESVVEFLLQDKRVDTRIANHDGEQALTLAANANIMSILLTKLTPRSVSDDNAIRVALFRAASRSDVDVVRMLLADNVSVHDLDKDGKTLLHAAAAGGNMEIMGLFIDRKMSVDAQDSCGRTPLHESARTGNTGAITALLAACANRSIQDKHGRTPLVVARQNANSMRHFRSMTLLDPSSSTMKPEQIKSHAKDLPLWSLANIGGPDLTSELKKRINEKDKCDLMDPDTGNSALHFAASVPRIKVLEALLASSVPRDSRNNEGQTPLHLAVVCDIRKCIDATMLLLHTTPSLLALRDRRGYTPLQISLRRSRFAVAVALLEAGADVDEVTNMFLHPTFVQAVELKNVKVAEMLIERGADQLKPGPLGLTARQIARELGDTEMLRVLNENESLFIPVKPPSIHDCRDDEANGRYLSDSEEEESWDTPPQSPTTTKASSSDMPKPGIVTRLWQFSTLVMLTH